MRASVAYTVAYALGLLIGALVTDQSSYFTGVLVGALSALCASFVADIVRGKANG